LPYPDTSYEGLVSTITNVAPILNWIYIDSNTYEVKYGVRDFAQPNLTGPFDCTRQDRRMMFEGWEGFVAVEQEPGLWALFFDRDDDGLRDKLGPGVRVLEVQLVRREKKVPKPEPEAAMTLEEKFKEQREENAQPTPPPDSIEEPAPSPYSTGGEPAAPVATEGDSKRVSPPETTKGTSGSTPPPEPITGDSEPVSAPVSQSPEENSQPTAASPPLTGDELKEPSTTSAGEVSKRSAPPKPTVEDASEEPSLVG
jgi:hypothetical protein